MSTRRPRLILYSGLGVDERLIGPQRDIVSADVEVPRWIDPLPDDTLASYARRMAARLTIDDRPLFVGGVSFGGMIAQEVSRHVPAAGLVLIATCLSNRGLPLPYRWACSIARHFPLWSINLAKPVIPRVRILMGITRDQHVEWFANMIADTDAAFLRWCLGAIADWEGAGAHGLPVVHVHGDHDLVVPAAWGHPTHLIPHAGHVCNVTHPTEVNAIIDAFIQQTIQSALRLRLQGSEPSAPSPKTPAPAPDIPPDHSATPACAARPRSQIAR